MRANRTVIAALCVALIQIGFLSWIIASRAAVLRDGREVVFLIKPVDPRDLLRGDYVQLSYEIDAISHEILVNPSQAGEITRAGTMFVRLKKGEDGYWHAASASLYEPFSKPAAPDEVEIVGKVGAGRSFQVGTTVDVDYGLNRFYLPEGEGRAIEHDMSVRGLGIRVAVASNGTAQIKALMDGQTLLYQEPPY